MSAMPAGGLYTSQNGPTPEKAQLGVPDRWMFCPKIGNIVANHFLPFKTPLCVLYDDQIEPRLRFHPDDVFRAPQLGKRKLGLWIDLTKTNRYYSTKEVENQGCKYVKLKCEGHGETPSIEDSLTFQRLVHSYLADNPDGIVGVHCTHGFNRTGFLIVSYIVELQSCAVDFAISMFASHRQPGIYKQDYINELFQRLEGTLDDAPPRPSWEFGEDHGLDDTAVAAADASTSNGHDADGTNGDATNSKAKAPKEFMDGRVPGVVYVSDPKLRRELQKKVRELCHAKRDGFPGSQPVSMETNNIGRLHHNLYMVSWKADGMRYLIFIRDAGEIYAFDRDNEVFQIPGLQFPHRKEPQRNIRDTLVDAEMIIDEVKQPDGTVQEQPRLLIYDIIAFEGMNVGRENFDTRRACMHKELIFPRTEAMKRGEIIREREPMSVRVKEFWDVQTTRKFFEPKFTATVGHEIDGLIFQPVDEPYVPGRCDSVLKWKPPSHNSIDFRLQIRKDQRPGMLPEHVGFLYVQHSQEPFGTMKATKALQQFNNKIIECRLSEKKEWIFMRERTDKSLPNAMSTAVAVWNSMMNPITKEGLVDYIERHGKKRGSPPSSDQKRASSEHKPSSEQAPPAKRARPS